MQDFFPVGIRPPRGGAITIATLALSAASAVVPVLLSGCHAAPAVNAFISTADDKAVEARLRPADSMPPLQPFDEGFVVVAQATN
jgi:hypothetical protein